MPRGTGIIIQANSDVEVFDNDIYGNGTVNLSIVTYGYETDDENYNPHLSPYKYIIIDLVMEDLIQM